MKDKVYNSVISGNADNNIKFVDFQNLLISLGFEFVRQRGSHTIYYHAGINTIMNIQKDGNKAKAYQVEQLRNILLENDLMES